MLTYKQTWTWRVQWRTWEKTWANDQLLKARSNNIVLTMGAPDQKLVTDHLFNCVVWWTRWSESERIDYQSAGTECLIRFVIFVLIFWAEVPDLDQSFANF